MNEHDMREKLRDYYNSVPEPPRQALELTVQAALRENEILSRRRSGVAIKPSFVSLIAAQIRATKGIIWVIQALAVFLVLITLAGTNDVSTPQDPSLVFAAYAAAASVIAGIGIAGIVYGSESALTEISFSCHFDYRQVVLARMAAYGIGDVVALVLLIVCGQAFVTESFTLIVASTFFSFFGVCFACLLLLSFYRGAHVFIACTVLAFLIAALQVAMWSINPSLLFGISEGMFIVGSVCLAAATVPCLRTFITHMNKGFEYVEARLD